MHPKMFTVRSTVHHRLVTNSLPKTHVRCLSKLVHSSSIKQQPRAHSSLSSAKSISSGSRLFSSSSVVSEELRKTDMYDFHLKNGAKMGSYGGYMMPISYSEMNHGELHNHVRKHAGLFDVGHMVQMKIFGPTTTDFLHYLTPSSLNSLLLESIVKSLQEPVEVPIYCSTLSVLLNENGGIIDDLMITRWGKDEYYLVTNATRRERDLAWIREKIEVWNKEYSGFFQVSEEKRNVQLEVLDGWGLLALQGPAALSVLQRQTRFHLNNIYFGRAAHIPILLDDKERVPLHVARGGYTGEDGFEISCPPGVAPTLARILLEVGPPKLAGLAVRDSLRIEAGLCLYGHELDEETSPNEASLTWVIGKSRRPIPSSLAPKPFIGFNRVRHELTYGPPRRRIGLVFASGAPAREGAKIYASADADEPIGHVTSGMPSPSLKKNIAMGIIQSKATSPTDKEAYLYKKGSTVYIDVRGRRTEAAVVALPFVKHKYFKGLYADLRLISDEYQGQIEPDVVLFYKAKRNFP